MKLSTSNLFILIWVIHLFVYHSVYVCCMIIAKQDYSNLYRSFIGIIMGLIGWFEQIPAFFVIPILIMLLLSKTKLKQQWFLAYAISVGIAYLGNYLWMFSNNTHDKILFSDKTINLIYCILPSLIVSVLCNWLIFRNNYKQLGV